MSFSIPILYEDNHLFILNKPSGLLTQPSGTMQDSLEQLAKERIKETYNKPGNVFLEAIHRLDKPVSGVAVFCKTSKALSRLNEVMRAKQTRKIYWAWLEGELHQDKGILEHYLFHDDFQSRVVAKEHPGAKAAKLSYHVLERKKGRTFVEIVLETGRYHQIRLQFSTLGFPVWGDHKYGSKQRYESDSIALHHRCLQIPHPITQELLVIEAPIPEVFSALGII